MKRHFKWMAAFTLTGALLTSSISSVEAATFRDVSETAEFYSAVEQLVAVGALSTQSGQFNPRNEITRGQAAKILAIAFDFELKPVTKSKFTDVAATAEFAPYIAALTDAGIINGYTDGTFKPNNKLTRGQMAKILANVLELPAGDVNQAVFLDVAATHSSAPYIYAIYEANITKGKDDGTFGVNETVKRSQFALFTSRALAHLNDGVNEEVDYSYLSPSWGSNYDEEGYIIEDFTYSKGEAVRTTDGKVFPATVNSNELFEVTVPDGELYIFKRYHNGQVHSEDLFKLSSKPQYEEGYLPFWKVEAGQSEADGTIEFADLFGIGNIFNHEGIRETYKLLDGDADHIQFVERYEEGLGDYMSVIITAPGSYYVQSNMDDFEMDAYMYIEVVEYNGELYYYYAPEIGA